VAGVAEAQSGELPGVGPHGQANLARPSSALPSLSVALSPADSSGDQSQADACRPIGTHRSPLTVQGGPCQPSCAPGKPNDKHIPGCPNASNPLPAGLYLGPVETHKSAIEAQPPTCAVREPPKPPTCGMTETSRDSDAQGEVSPVTSDKQSDCRSGTLVEQNFQEDAVEPAHPALLDRGLTLPSGGDGTQAQTRAIGVISSVDAFSDDETTSQCPKKASATEISTAVLEETIRTRSDNSAAELEQGIHNPVDRSSRALASEMEMPELKLAIMRRTSLNRALTALGLSCLFSVAGLIGVVTRLADTCTQGGTDQAASLTFIYLNGIAMTAGGLLLLFVTISYPQRILVRAMRRKWTPLPQQLALIVLIIVLAVTPISSIYRVLLYWFNVAQVHSLDEKGECIAAALRADELDFNFIFNGGATIVIGAMLFEWAAVIKLSEYKTLGVIRAMRKDSALPRDRLFESMMSDTDDGGEDHEHGETCWSGDVATCSSRYCDSCPRPLTLFRKICAFFSMKSTPNIFTSGLQWQLSPTQWCVLSWSWCWTSRRVSSRSSAWSPLFAHA